MSQSPQATGPHRLRSCLHPTLAGWATGLVLVLMLMVMGTLPAAASCPGGMVGTGSDADNACEITDRSDLEAIDDSAATLDLYYRLMNDLDLGGTNWTPLGDADDPFTGHFDGGGFTISNLTLNTAADYTGLFGVIGNGSVTRVTLANPTLSTSAQYAGVLAGEVFLTDETAVIINAIELTSPTLTSTFTGNAYVGGLVGSIDIEDSLELDTAQVTITNITISGLSLDADGERAGGLAGRMVAGNDSRLDIAVENVLLTSPQMTVADDYVGGITGEAENEGEGETTLRQLSVRDGVITAETGKYVGGLVGRLRDNSSLDQRNVFIGTVSGEHSVGGLVGRLSSNSVLNFGYTQATVNGNDTTEDGESRAGLIAGYTSSNDQVVTEVYAVGEVTHDDNTVTDLGIIGRVGSSGDLYEDIYYHVTTGSLDFIGSQAGAPTVTNATELTAEQMQGNQARVNMIGVADPSRWDFTQNWVANEGDYPIFRWEVEEFEIEVNEPTIFAVGDGSAEAPFQIATWTDLQNISLVANEGHHFILMNDLDASSAGYDSEVKDGQVLANDQLGWKPIGRWISSTDFSKAFNGTFDGQNNTISGLRFDRDEGMNLGLFAAINDATIKNLTLTDAELNATGTSDAQVKHVALLAAHAGTFEIDNVSITGQVSVATSNSDSLTYIGGVISEAHVSGTEQDPISIKNSDFDVALGIELATGANPKVQYVGGIIGRADESFFAIESTDIAGRVDIAPADGSTDRGGNVKDIGFVVGQSDDDWSLSGMKINGVISVDQMANVNDVALGLGRPDRRVQITNTTVTGQINATDVLTTDVVGLVTANADADWVIDGLVVDGAMTIEGSGGIKNMGFLAGAAADDWVVDNTTMDGVMSLTTTSASSGAIDAIAGVAGDTGTDWAINATTVNGDLTLSAPNASVQEVSLGAAVDTSGWTFADVNLTGSIDITAGGRVDDVGLVAARTWGQWSLSDVGVIGDISITAGDGVANVGGLLGYRNSRNNSGDYTIATTYTQGKINVDAQGDVANVGGLIGEIALDNEFDQVIEADMAFNITNAYSTMDVGIESTGAVSGVGGLIGNGAEAVFSDQAVELNLTRTYYAGLVDLPADATDVGGLIGRYEDTDLTVTGGFWDNTLNTLPNDQRGEPASTAELKVFSTFDAAWNGDGLTIVEGWQAPNNPSWGICPAANEGLPMLLAQFSSNPCVPAAPTALTATAGNREVTIAFTEANAFGGTITGYEYSLDGGQTWIAFDAGTVSSPVTITQLASGTDYAISLRAVSDAGAGPASAVVLAAPFPIVPVPTLSLTALLMLILLVLGLGFSSGPLRQRA